MAKKILNVAEISDRYRQEDADKRDLFSKTVTGLGVEFLCAASFLRDELIKTNDVNVRALHDVTEVGAQLAGYAFFHGYDEVVVPHHTVTKTGRMIKHNICPSLSDKFDLKVRCQPVGYIPLGNFDGVTRTCLSDGLRGYTGAIPNLRAMAGLRKVA